MSTIERQSPPDPLADQAVIDVSVLTTLMEGAEHCG